MWGRKFYYAYDNLRWGEQLLGIRHSGQGSGDTQERELCLEEGYQHSWLLKSDTADRRDDGHGSFHRHPGSTGGGGVRSS